MALKYAIKKLQLPRICNTDELHTPLKWVRPVAANAAPCGVIAKNCLKFPCVDNPNNSLTAPLSGFTSMQGIPFPAAVDPALSRPASSHRCQRIRAAGNPFTTRRPSWLSLPSPRPIPARATATASRRLASCTPRPIRRSSRAAASNPQHKRPA